MGCQALSSGNLYGVVSIMYYLRPKVICKRRGDEVGLILLGPGGPVLVPSYGQVGHTCKEHEAEVFGALTFFVGYEMF